jgi:hypothetical protein
LYGVSDTIQRYPYSKGMFISDSLYTYYPINGKQDYEAGNIYNPPVHENPGDLGMNLVINHNVSTRDTLFENPTSILTPVNGFLKIANGKTFDMITAATGYNILVVQDSSTLTLEANSRLLVNAGNRLLLRKTGTISLGYNSEILFKDGSSFCNQGGLITSPQGGTGMIPGKITIDSGYHPSNWCLQISEFIFKDSVKLVLKEGAVLEIPDSAELHFTGNQSGLIMNPNSKLLMGEGSKISFDNSAVLIANGRGVWNIYCL